MFGAGFVRLGVGYVLNNYMLGAGFVQLGVGYVNSTITCPEPDLSGSESGYVHSKMTCSEPDLSMSATSHSWGPLDIKEDTNSKSGDINSDEGVGASCVIIGAEP